MQGIVTRLDVPILAALGLMVGDPDAAEQSAEQRAAFAAAADDILALRAIPSDSRRNTPAILAARQLVLDADASSWPAVPHWLIGAPPGGDGIDFALPVLWAVAFLQDTVEDTIGGGELRRRQAHDALNRLGAAALARLHAAGVASAEGVQLDFPDMLPAIDAVARTLPHVCPVLVLVPPPPQRAGGLRDAPDASLCAGPIAPPRPRLVASQPAAARLHHNPKRTTP